MLLNAGDWRLGLNLQRGVPIGASCCIAYSGENDQAPTIVGRQYTSILSQVRLGDFRLRAVGVRSPQKTDVAYSLQLRSAASLGTRPSTGPDPVGIRFSITVLVLISPWNSAIFFACFFCYPNTILKLPLLCFSTSLLCK